MGRLERWWHHTRADPANQRSGRGFSAIAHDGTVIDMTRSAGGHGSGRLRVIAGELRGRRLLTMPGHVVRPTADRVREALFDILGPTVRGADFLDAFAGTGAIGIEALSRGAASVVFIENARAIVELLNRNLDLTGMAATKARVLPWDLARAIRSLEEDGLDFDIIFLDPPYAGDDLDAALQVVSRSRLLREGGVVVAEHESRRSAIDAGELIARRTAAYGRTSLTFLGRPGPVSASR
jgi:16S rRNA (guanine966-N2)-methyltransferase